MKLLALDDPTAPLFRLSSYEDRASKVLKGLYVKGMLDVDLILDLLPKLFVGEEVRGRYILTMGKIVGYPPRGGEADWQVRPSFALFCGLPEPEPKRKLSGLFPLAKVRLALKGDPAFDTATQTSVPRCSIVWAADLTLPIASSTNIPVSMRMESKDGPVEFWSDMTDGVSLAWESLSGLIPGVALNMPDSGFHLQDLIKLTELRMTTSRDGSRELHLDSIGLQVATSADKNRWVLVEGLLTLDAIRFDVVINNPLNAPSIFLSLSGLIAIGDTGALELSANSSYPAVGDLEIEDFSFSLAPRAQVYKGEITISGDWKLLDTLSLTSVSFQMAHDASEDDTAFRALGVLVLGDAELYLSADYESGGRGWTFQGGMRDNDEIPISEWIDQLIRKFGISATIALPETLKGLVLLNLGMRINTVAREYSFQGVARFPVDGQPAPAAQAGRKFTELGVQLDVDASLAKFRGYLTLFEREFSVLYNTAGLMIASYDGSQAAPIDLKAFLTEISTAIGDKVAPGIAVDLKHAQLVFDKRGDTSKFFLA